MATDDPFLSPIDNATTEPAPEDPYYNYYVELVKIISIIGYSITFVLGVVGNGLVIWIAGFKMKRMVNTIWFLNLGVADFTFDLLLPLLITEWAMDGHWPFGWIMCKVINTVLFLNMTVSTSFLMIISIDRCVSVVCPVWSKNHRSPRLAIIVSKIIWLLCLTLSSPYLAFFDVEQEFGENISYCVPVYAQDYQKYNVRHKAMLLTRLVSMFIVPFSVILVCYGIIIIRLRRSRNLSVSNRPFKVIISIVFSFFCCWFPFHFCPLIDFAYLDTTWETDLIVYYLSICLAYFNSCLNPILYVFIGRDFKKSLIRSIPFLLESTFRERCDFNSGNQCDQTVMGTELESYNA